VFSKINFIFFFEKIANGDNLLLKNVVIGKRIAAGEFGEVI